MKKQTAALVAAILSHTGLAAAQTILTPVQLTTQVPHSVRVLSICLGCCGAGDNQCYPGNTNAACGFGGFTCDGCTPGQTCLSGFCQ